MNEGGEFFCEEHYLPADHFCIHCDRWARRWDARTHRCEDCYRRLVVVCCMCGDETDDAQTYNRQYYCPTCYEEHFFTCHCCGETVHEDDVSFYSGDHPYCRECIVDSHIKPYNANVLSCLGKDYVGKFPKDRILMGVELETEAEGNFPDTVHRLAETVGDFCIFKRDGSLSDEGIEIVSLPATLTTHKELWDKFFNRLPQGLVSWTGENCGMHVHVSRKPLGMLRIGKMIVFLNDKNNRSLVTQIAGRYGNDYCVPKQKSITQVEGEDRYEMLNLLPTDTVEFRIFRGTLNREHFYANLEFVDSLVRFCGRESIRRINKECYLEYVRKNRKEYPYLVDFLRKRDLTSTTISNEGER